MELYLLGRVIFGAYFIYSGFNHFKDEKAMTGYAKSKGVPSPRIAVLVGGVLLILGGLGFVIGVNIWQASIALLLFLIPTTFMMHAFWKVADPMHRMGERINFFKNLAIIGALLMML